MLPKFRVILATTTAALALMGFALGLLFASRSGSLFAIGLRSAQGSPIERSLPEPPDWKQFVARSTLRRSEELSRLLDLPTGASADAASPDTTAPSATAPSEADIVAAIDRAAAIAEPAPLVLPPPDDP